MGSTAIWSQDQYKEFFVVIILFLLLVGSVLFFLRKKSERYHAAWASTRSWFFTTPFILGTLALAPPIPLLMFCLVAIFSAKTFFKMVGMYHRSWFVWLTYIFIFGFGHVIYHHIDELYDLLPMIFFAGLALIPILRNSATHMIQYWALSLLCLLFFGWSFMHFGRLLVLEKGTYLVLYIFLLTEFSESVAAAVRLIAKRPILKNISKRVTIEGFVAALVLTLLLAWGLRHMMIDRSEKYWIVAALIATIFGRLGDLTLAVIRKDLGIKATGLFIIGRDDILARTGKLIFVGPIFYYAYQSLQGAL